VKEIEGKVIDILVRHEATRSAYGEPILAVSRVMGWTTAQTTKFVGDLIERSLIHWEPMRDGQHNDSKSIWKKGPIGRTYGLALRANPA